MYVRIAEFYFSSINALRKNEEEMNYGIHVYEGIFVTMVTNKLSFKIITFCNFSCKKTLSFFIMEPRNELNCICMNVDDMASLEEVLELYWNNSSSESGDDDECYDGESDMYNDTLESDLSEKAKVRTFYENTCKCMLAEGDRPCSTTLTLDDFSDS